MQHVEHPPPGLENPPLPLLCYPQQLTDQGGVGPELHLHPALLQGRQGPVRPHRPSQPQSQALWAELVAAVQGAVSQASPGACLGLLQRPATLVGHLDHSLPFIQGLGHHTWEGEMGVMRWSQVTFKSENREFLF